MAQLRYFRATMDKGGMSYYIYMSGITEDDVKKHLVTNYVNIRVEEVSEIEFNKAKTPRYATGKN